MPVLVVRAVIGPWGVPVDRGRVVDSRGRFVARAGDCGADGNTGKAPDDCCPYGVNLDMPMGRDSTTREGACSGENDDQFFHVLTIAPAGGQVKRSFSRW